MSEARSLATRDYLVGGFLCIAYIAVLLVTESDLAMSRDESFYARAAKNSAAWLSQLVTDPSMALDRASIDRAWRYNWEHPAWMKLMFALSWMTHDAFGIFGAEATAIRFPGMLSAGLLLWLIYAWAAAVMPRGPALFSALAFGSMPRVFYHSHLDCFDIPIAFFSTLVAYLYWRSLSDRRWVPLLGIAFGLALATKHNSWILPGVLMIHFTWIRIDQAKAGRPARSSASWLVSMLVLGPLLFFATWPWLWYDTWNRLGAYVTFHVRHVHYTYQYLGVSYFEPPLPFSVPFVMTLFTVSLPVLALMLVGLCASRRCLVPPWSTQPGSPTTRRTEVLWLGCMLAPLLAIALPSSPIFGGTKHWLTAYPFLVLFAGLGLCAAIEHAPRWWRAGRGGASWAFAGLCLLPGTVQTAHSHPFGLSHYMPIAGGVPGAADLGMNRQFWGFTTGRLVPWLVEKLPNGGRVWIGDTTYDAWLMLQADARLPENIRAVRSMSEADFALVHHERHFAEVDYQAWVAYGTSRPVHVLRYDGVPIISVYENPMRLEVASD
jgi:4-amino-4-deoxy-L-arabinose transferase-like glycosyltransferase